MLTLPHLAALCPLCLHGFCKAARISLHRTNVNVSLSVYLIHYVRIIPPHTSLHASEGYWQFLYAPHASCQAHWAGHIQPVHCMSLANPFFGNWQLDIWPGTNTAWAKSTINCKLSKLVRQSTFQQAMHATIESLPWHPAACMTTQATHV